LSAEALAQAEAMRAFLFTREFTTKLELFSKKIDSAFVCAASAPVCNWLSKSAKFSFHFFKIPPARKKKRVENFRVLNSAGSGGGSSAV